MRVAIVGLDTSHPFTQAAFLAQAGASFVVADENAERRARFLERFDGQEAASPQDLRGHRPDLAIVSARPAHLPRIAETLLGARIPVFAHKPAAGTRDHLRALDAAVSAHATPFSTGSVLRFAPAFTELRERCASTPPLAFSAAARHDISLFEPPAQRWQDDPDEGGGTIMTMGVHALDAISAVAGDAVGELADATALSSTVAREWSRSEDNAALSVAWADGRLASVHILGIGEQWYRVTAHTPEGSLSAAVGGPAAPVEDFGYAEASDAAMEMARTGRPMVPWIQSRQVFDALLRAKESSRRRRARDGDVK